ncbi:MAG: DMT family transporter [Pseudomonadota bacterium]
MNAETNSNKKGIVFVMLGLCIAASTGASMKLLGGDMHAAQITWIRFTGFAAIVLPIVVWRLGAKSLRAARSGIQFVRGLTMAGGTVAFVLGVKTVDFADSIAILYAYPFLLIVFAAIFLRESVSWQGYLGVFGGFVGVLLVMRPEFSSVNIGTLLVFLCAVIVAIQMTLNRVLGAISHPLVTSFWGATVAAISLTIWMVLEWQPVRQEDYAPIAYMIVSGAASQLLIVSAFTHASASTLAPFTYFEIVAAIFLGYFVFGTVPTWLSWIGIALIVISGVFVARSLQASNTPRRAPKI